MFDEAEAMERYERALLTVLGVEWADHVETWSRVYDRVSRAMTSEAEAGESQPSSAIARDEADLRDLDAVWGLIYSARSYAIARRLFAEAPPPSGLFVELGAGWGPFGLAAAELGRPVLLVDVAGARLERARALFRAMSLPEPAIQQADANRALPKATKAVALSYALGEIVRRERDPVAAGARSLEAWLKATEESGLVYVAEPGDRESSRRLQLIRDAIVQRLPIAAPCTGAPCCPALAKPTDWCHFTGRLPIGPVARRIADAAERRWQEVHFSYLILGRHPEPGVERVLEVRGEREPKARALLCSKDGFVSLTALRRNAPVWDRLIALKPNARVRIARDQAIPKGDGLRIESQSAIEVLDGPVPRETPPVNSFER